MYDGYFISTNILESFCLKKAKSVLRVWNKKNKSISAENVPSSAPDFSVDVSRGAERTKQKKDNQS